MDTLDALQALIASIVAQFGLYVQIPAFVVGVILVIAAGSVMKSATKETGLLARIFSGAALVFGIPILLSAFGVGTTDGLLLGLSAMFGVGVWLSAVKGTAVTLLGIVVVLAAFAAIVSVTASNPSGSIVADGFREIYEQAVAYRNSF